MSFWGTLGTIGAVAATALTGGAAAPLIPIAAGIGGAIDARNAEKKAAKQEVAGDERAANVYAPYNARGNAAGDTLAGYLGINVPSGGFAGQVDDGSMEGDTAGPRPSRTAMQNRTPISYRPVVGGLHGLQAPQTEAITLASMMQSRARQSLPQTPSASSYSGRMN